MHLGQTLKFLEPMHMFARADWIHRDRVLAWSGALLTIEAALLALGAFWSYGAFPSVGASNPTDFVSFYAAGKLALSGSSTLSYVHTAHAAAEVAAIGYGHPYIYFYYPPTFLLWCASLALLPPLVAFLSFEALSLGAWIVITNRILRASGWRWIVPTLAYPAVGWTLFLGQNSLLTAALLGATTLLLDDRPILAGIMLGTICYKPDLALVAPIALAAGGHWRAFGAASLTVAFWIVLSIGLFGIHIWLDYWKALTGSAVVYNTRVTLWLYITPYGAVRVLGGGARLGWIIQAGIAGIAASMVAWIWRRNPGTAVRSAALASGMLLTAPIALMYDLMILMVAIAWLVRIGRKSGFLKWEKLILCFCFVVPLVSPLLGEKIHVPLGPLAPAAILALCLKRTVRPNLV
jgi:Glycosyltransferase family 87